MDPVEPDPQELRNPVVIPSEMETVSLKFTKPQGRALEKAAKARGFPSKSEFVRYALARALEEELDVKTVEEIFEARRQIRKGRTVPSSAWSPRGDALTFRVECAELAAKKFRKLDKPARGP